MTHTPADELRCSDCGHAHHGADVECEATVEHGPKHWHRCLCLARPYASTACPQPMHCQGGALGYTDVYYLQRGQAVTGPGGRVITPDVLKLAPWADGDPLMEAMAAAVYEQTTTKGSLVVDDPRNIAAVAATVAREVLGTTGEQPDATARETEAQPPEHRWRVQMYDPLAEQWNQFSPKRDRDEAVEQLRFLNTTTPRWADDGTPVRRRLMRETTTYTVEEPAVGEQPAVVQPEPTVADTLAQWLYRRFMPDGAGWDNLDDDDRSYWEHEARAVRRAVARGGFKSAAAPTGNPS